MHTTCPTHWIDSCGIDDIHREEWERCPISAFGACLERNALRTLSGRIDKCGASSDNSSSSCFSRRGRPGKVSSNKPAPPKNPRPQPNMSIITNAFWLVIPQTDWYDPPLRTSWRFRRVDAESAFQIASLGSASGSLCRSCRLLRPAAACDPRSLLHRMW